MKKRSIMLISVALSALLGAACSKAKDQEDAPTTAAKPDKAKPAEGKPDKAKPGAMKMGAKPAFMDGLMKPYEDCRALLAADKGAGVSDCAKAMSAAAKGAQEAASGAVKEHLGAIATAADALAGTPADDVEKLRLAYGDVSKSVVALLTATPAAAKDYHVFECPMAKGYKRWAQADKNMANPYMGTKMLECGSEVHDHHKGMMGDGHMKADDHKGMH